MDNQQTLTDLDIGWLCGFFDGEGSVDMNVSQNYSALKKKNTRRHTVIVPRLNVVNTNYGSIMKFKNLLNSVGVGVHIGTKKRRNPKYLMCYQATINGHKRVLKAIPILNQGCIVKKPALTVLAKWLEHRENHWHYSLKDYELYQEFRKADGKGLNDSTLRRLYDSCTAEEYKPRDYPTMAWESRRKVESGRLGNQAG